MKAKILAIIFLCTTLCVGFTSCGDDSDEPTTSTDIFGEWDPEKYTGEDLVFTLKDDGDGDYIFFVEKDRYGDDPEGTFSFTKKNLILKRDIVDDNGMLIGYRTYKFSYTIQGDVWRDQLLVLVPNSAADAGIFGLKNANKITFERYRH